MGSSETLKGGDPSNKGRNTLNKADIAMCSEEIECADVKLDVTDMDVSVNSKNQCVLDMINTFFLAEYLKDSNRYYCDTCSSLQHAYKFIDSVKFPMYLVLTLKRFNYDVKSQKRNKILQTVDYPATFSLCKDCPRSNQNTAVAEQLKEEITVAAIADNCCNQSVKYRLSSIIVHSGSSSDSGHYYSYVCRYSSSGCQWFSMNDSQITHKSTNTLPHVAATYPRDTPYVFIYEQYTIVENLYQTIMLPWKLQEMVDSDNQVYIQVNLSLC